MKSKTLYVIITIVTAVVAIVTSWTSSSILMLNVKAVDATNNATIHRVQAGGGSTYCICN